MSGLSAGRHLDRERSKEGGISRVVSALPLLARSFGLAAFRMTSLGGARAEGCSLSESHSELHPHVEDPWIFKAGLRVAPRHKWRGGYNFANGKGPFFTT